MRNKRGADTGVEQHRMVAYLRLHVAAEFPY